MVDLSKFTSNEKILNEVESLTTTKFVAKLYPQIFNV